MRGLIVREVLPGDGKAILRIVHQRVEAVFRGDRRGVDAHCYVVFGVQHDLLTPIAFAASAV